MLVLSAELVENPAWERWLWDGEVGDEPVERFVQLKVGSAVIAELPVKGQINYRGANEDAVAETLAEFFGGEK